MLSLILALSLGHPANVRPAQLIEVLDGDTARLMVDLGFDVHKRVSIRVLDLWCPEVRGVEAPEGLIAKIKARQLLEAYPLYVPISTKRSFTRWVSPIYLKTVKGELRSFADVMVETSSCTADRR